MNEENGMKLVILRSIKNNNLAAGSIVAKDLLRNVGCCFDWFKLEFLLKDKNYFWEGDVVVSIVVRLVVE